jgi:hypothetical protein
MFCTCAGPELPGTSKDIGLGTPFLREIDRGLAKSKVRIVLVTPALERPTFQ